MIFLATRSFYWQRGRTIFAAFSLEWEAKLLMLLWFMIWGAYGTVAGNYWYGWKEPTVLLLEKWLSFLIEEVLSMLWFLFFGRRCSCLCCEWKRKKLEMFVAVIKQTILYCYCSGLEKTYRCRYYERGRRRCERCLVVVVVVNKKNT